MEVEGWQGGGKEGAFDLTTHTSPVSGQCASITVGANCCTAGVDRRVPSESSPPFPTLPFSRLLSIHNVVEWIEKLQLGGGHRVWVWEQSLLPWETLRERKSDSRSGGGDGEDDDQRYWSSSWASKRQTNMAAVEKDMLSFPILVAVGAVSIVCTGQCSRADAGKNQSRQEDRTVTACRTHRVAEGVRDNHTQRRLVTLSLLYSSDGFLPSVDPTGLGSSVTGVHCPSVPSPITLGSDLLPFTSTRTKAQIPEEGKKKTLFS